MPDLGNTTAPARAKRRSTLAQINKRPRSTGARRLNLASAYPTQARACSRPEQVLQRLAQHGWRDQFDWRAHEARPNRLSHYIATIGGNDIHFVHQLAKEINRSSEVVDDDS